MTLILTIIILIKRHQLSEQLICYQCLSAPNANRQTLRPECFTLSFHQRFGNLKEGAANMNDVFADNSTPIMVYAATKAIENEIANLHSCYRAQIDALKKDWHKDDNKFVFRPRYKP